MPDRSNNTEKGRAGEDRAAAFLCGLGYRIVARNVHLPGGEIDVVRTDGATLVIVEVKRRESFGFDSALAAVDSRKRATLRRIVADYAQIVAPSARIRFDVVTLDGNRLSLHRNAF